MALIGIMIIPVFEPIMCSMSLENELSKNRHDSNGNCMFVLVGAAIALSSLQSFYLFRKRLSLCLD